MSSRRSEDEPPRLKPGDEIDELFGRANPNPARVGCPPRSVLVEMARRERPIGDPIYEHLTKCSPCYVEVRSIQETDKQQRPTQTVTTVVLATAAAVTLLL